MTDRWSGLPRCPACCRRWACVSLSTGALLERPHRRRMLVGALMPGMIVNARTSVVLRRSEEGGSVGGATV